MINYVKHFLVLLPKQDVVQLYLILLQFEKPGDINPMTTTTKTHLKIYLAFLKFSLAFFFMFHS